VVGNEAGKGFLDIAVGTTSAGKFAGRNPLEGDSFFSWFSDVGTRVAVDLWEVRCENAKVINSPPIIPHENETKEFEVNIVLSLTSNSIKRR